MENEIIIPLIGAVIGGLLGSIISPLINTWGRKKEIEYNFNLERKKEAYEIIIKLLINLINMFEDLKKPSIISLDLKAFQEYENKIKSIIGNIPPLSKCFVKYSVRKILKEYMESLNAKMNTLHSNIIDQLFVGNTEKEMKKFCEEEIKKAIQARDLIFKEVSKEFNLQ